MNNKNGFSLGKGECPCNCNDEVACDWFGSHWVNCHIFKKFMEKFFPEQYEKEKISKMSAYEQGKYFAEKSIKKHSVMLK